MHTRPAAAVLLALLLAGACRSPEPADAPPRVVGPQLIDCRPQGEETPTECRHAWQQVDVHPYTRLLNGVPSVELCAVLQCAKCGRVRHECQRQARR